MSQTSPVTESLIENLLQACVDYERCERFDAKHRRLDLEEAKQAIRDAIGHAQTGQQPTVDELGGLIEHGLGYGIASKDARLAARIVIAALSDTSTIREGK